jgi:Tol biopolymer transport system component/serine/threonine protein kinase
MTLAAGSRLGPYEILSLLGSGGMGEVYRARDPRLGRDVAIKVLPAAFSADADRLRRFEQEARAAAALNHPNIVTIHSVEEANGLRFLTMELVEGKPLSDLIPKNGMPLDRLLNIATPLASALSAAHSKGITHRDLKPANVMIGAEGQVKILDFGLAKLREAAPAEVDMTGLATEPITSEGRIVGTVAYMSPEQAEGKSIDPRSDIFSLGVILYELATGERPFKGDTTISTITSILRDTPRPITELNHTLPRDLAKIVRHCLVKDVEHRYQTAKDLRNDLEELKRDIESGEVVTPAAIHSVPPAQRWPRAVMAVVAVAAFATLLVWRWTSHRSTGTGPVPVEATFTQLTSEPGAEVSPSLSPDGRWIVYSSAATGHAAIYLRSVGGQLAINLTKDSPADDTQPTFSPDGEWIAFRSERDGGGIFVMGRTGESVRRLTDAGFNPAWSPTGEEVVFADDWIYNDPFTRTRVSALWAVTVATGAKRLITKGDAVQPHWSPHGDRIAYWAIPWGGSGGGQRDLWTVPARGGTAVQVTDDPATDWNPLWSPDGKFLYFASDRGGSMNLWRVPIDEHSGKVLGRPEAITAPAPFVGDLSIAADGRHLAYASIVVTSNLQTVAFDPSTKKVTGDPVSVTTGSKSYRAPALSPDGAWVVFASTLGQEDIFVCRVDGTGLRQLTNDAAKDRWPRWSPDGQRIAFYSDRGGRYNVWILHPDGSGLEPLTDGADLHVPFWSPDGSRMVATDVSAGPVYLFDPRIPWHQQQPERLPPYPDGQHFLAWSWSPDGKRLAGWFISPRGGIVTYSLGSRTYETLTDFGGWPVWLNDNDGLVFASQSKVLLVNRARQVRELLSVAPHQINNLAVSSDNRRLMFDRTVTEADIWLATLK